MPTQRTSLNVSLTPELERFIAARVASGHYQSASEVVRAGLRLLLEREGATARRRADGTPRRPSQAGPDERAGAAAADGGSRPPRTE